MSNKSEYNLWIGIQKILLMKKNSGILKSKLDLNVILGESIL